MSRRDDRRTRDRREHDRRIDEAIARGLALDTTNNSRRQHDSTMEDLIDGAIATPPRPASGSGRRRRDRTMDDLIDDAIVTPQAPGGRGSDRRRRRDCTLDDMIDDAIATPQVSARGRDRPQRRDHEMGDIIDDAFVTPHPDRRRALPGLVEHTSRSRSSRRPVPSSRTPDARPVRRQLNFFEDEPVVRPARQSSAGPSRRSSRAGPSSASPTPLCEICGLASQAMARHILDYHPDDPESASYVCKWRNADGWLCLARFRSAAMCKTHRDAVHKGGQPPPAGPSCAVCRKKYFNNAEERNSHMRRVHLGVRVFGCPWPGCEEDFISEDVARAHGRWCKKG